MQRILAFFLMLIVVSSGCIFGGCSQTKRILTGSAVPSSAGWHIHNGQGWKTLDQLDQVGAVVYENALIANTCGMDGARTKDNVVPLQVVGKVVLIAKRLTPTEQEGRNKIGGAVDVARLCISVVGIQSKDESPYGKTEISSREDRSKYEDGYILFEYTLDGFPFYAIYAGCEPSWIVVTV